MTTDALVDADSRALRGVQQLACENRTDFLTLHAWVLKLHAFSGISVHQYMADGWQQIRIEKNFTNRTTTVSFGEVCHLFH